MLAPRGSSLDLMNRGRGRSGVTDDDHVRPRRPLIDQRLYCQFRPKLAIEALISIMSYRPGLNQFANPSIRQSLEAHHRVIVIDEIQKIPSLLDQVHTMIEKHKRLRFILTGSSTRRLKERGVNLLAGRARSLFLHPLTSNDMPSKINQNLSAQHWSILSFWSCVPTWIIETTSAPLRSGKLRAS